MSRLIDADALEKDGWMMHRTVRVNKDTMSYQTKKPTDFPTIEARKKGKWIYHHPGWGWGETWICSECGEKTTSTVMGKPRYKWCPMCGSDMREVEE